MNAKIVTKYPTVKQYRFIRDLLTTRDWSSLSSSYRARLDVLTMEIPEFVLGIDQGRINPDADGKITDGPLDLIATRKLIDTIKDLPRKSGRPQKIGGHALVTDFPTIPDGRYAVLADAGHLAFYKIDVPDADSDWYGKIFVNVLASAEKHPIRGLAAKAILEKIAVDPMSAAKKYGQELKHCSRCGRSLTEETSRELGIGPDCRREWGL